jgi:hypothetical protein
MGRAAVVRAIADSATLKQTQYNAALYLPNTSVICGAIRTGWLVPSG